MPVSPIGFVTHIYTVEPLDTLGPDIFGHFCCNIERGFPLMEAENALVTPVGD